jgi:hypothetical protein
MKIGLIITPYKYEELEKNEMIPINYERSWLQTVNPKFIIEEDDKEWVTDDIAIYYYLKETFKNKYIIEYIMGNDPLIYEKVKRCDVVFLLIFDMVEAFHTLSQSEFKEMKRTFMLPNVYPPYLFQNFINNKNKYYDYLKEKGINVLPMVYISSEEFKKNPKACVDKVLTIKRGDDQAFIGKPIFGQEMIDFEVFDKNTKDYKVIKYLERITALYDGCIFQPYIKYLAKNYEFRVYFIGDKYYYTIRTKYLKENNTFEAKFMNMDEHTDNIQILQFAKKVFSQLPKLKMGSKYVDKLVTRIDISCCFENQRFFVSEIEFVPSLFSNQKQVADLMIDKIIGDQLIKIVLQMDIKSIQPLQKKYIPLIIGSCILFFIILVIILILVIFYRKTRNILI